MSLLIMHASPGFSKDLLVAMGELCNLVGKDWLINYFLSGFASDW